MLTIPPPCLDLTYPSMQTSKECKDIKGKKEHANYTKKKNKAKKKKMNLGLPSKQRFFKISS